MQKPFRLGRLLSDEITSVKNSQSTHNRKSNWVRTQARPGPGPGPGPGHVGSSGRLPRWALSNEWVTVCSWVIEMSSIQLSYTCAHVTSVSSSCLWLADRRQTDDNEHGLNFKWSVNFCSWLSFDIWLAMKQSWRTCQIKLRRITGRILDFLPKKNKLHINFSCSYNG